MSTTDDAVAPRSSPSNLPSHSLQNAAPKKQRSLFDIPPPLKRLFDQFPLVTYPENALPLRASRPWDEHVLYVFTTDDDARTGRPSFNPACLRWQTYLKFSQLTFRVERSNNHASPSGALPFLLPSAPTDASDCASVPSGRLKRWIAAQSGVTKISDPLDVRYEACQALVEYSVRKAWLYQLYLHSSNAPVLHQLYVAPCSSNPLVQIAIAQQLRQAAAAEVLKISLDDSISEAEVRRETDQAFSSLSTILGEDSEWFFTHDAPGWFDASVFAYTHLLLDDALRWKENGVAEDLKKYPNLVRHRDRILEMYY